MANQPLSRLRKLQEEAQAMLDEKDLVLQDEHRLPRTRRFLHFWLLVGKSFVRNRCPVRAAALAYTTLLALVPLLAVIVSVTTGFLKQEEGKEQIRVWIQTSIDKFAPQIGLAEVAEGEAIDAREQVVSKIITYVENFRSGTLGVTAVLVLVFVAISLLSSIEATFNDMWGVAQGRRWVSRVIHYWAALTLGPLFLLVAAGFANLKNYTAAAVTPDELNAQAKLIERTLARNQMPASLIGVTNTATMAVFEFRARTAAEVPRIASLSNQLAKVVRAHKAPFISPVSGTDRFVIETPLHDRKALMLEQLRHVLDDLPFISLLTSHVLPIVILTVMFGVFYLLMPNTKVHWKAAVAGGLAAGLLLHLNASFNTIYVSRVVTYSKVYGSLGLVPIFLIGLYFSWLIVLFGGQVAYAMQNRKAYLQEKLAESINHRGREFVALRMMTLIGQRFSS
ncbi:MAG: YihY/virulence factor BrkB family protein, partial [Verrucomicrobiota bacterium]